MKTVQVKYTVQISTIIRGVGQQEGGLEVGVGSREFDPSRRQGNVEAGWLPDLLERLQMQGKEVRG